MANVITNVGLNKTAEKVGGTATVADFNYVAIGLATNPNWAANTSYNVGDKIVPTTANGYWYKCTTAGTSDSAEPTWGTTIGGTTTDNTVVWTCEGGDDNALAEDTELQSEVTTGGGARAQVTPTVSGAVLTLTNTFNFTDSFTIQEAGIFNDATAGDLYARSTFGAVNVVNGDSFQITFNITYSA